MSSTKEIKIYDFEKMEKKVRDFIEQKEIEYNLSKKDPAQKAILKEKINEERKQAFPDLDFRILAPDATVPKFIEASMNDIRSIINSSKPQIYDADLPKPKYTVKHGYRSVLNLVYDSLIPEKYQGILRKKVQRKNVLLKDFKEIYKSGFVNLYETSLTEAFMQLAESSSKFRQQLLNTKIYVYQDLDKMFSFTDKSVLDSEELKYNFFDEEIKDIFVNMIGKVLTHVKNNLLDKMKKAENIARMRQIYMAYWLVMELTKSDNVDSETYDNILRLKTGDFVKLYIDLLPKDINLSDSFLEKISQTDDNFRIYAEKEIKVPNTLVLSFLNNNIPRISERIIKNRNNFIFDLYFRTIKAKYDGVDIPYDYLSSESMIDRLKSQFFTTGEEYDAWFNTVLYNYEKGNLDSHITTETEKKFKLISKDLSSLVSETYKKIESEKKKSDKENALKNQQIQRQNLEKEKEINKKRDEIIEMKRNMVLSDSKPYENIINKLERDIDMLQSPVQSDDMLELLKLEDEVKYLSGMIDNRFNFENEQQYEEAVIKLGENIEKIQELSNKVYSKDELELMRMVKTVSELRNILFLQKNSSDDNQVKELNIKILRDNIDILKKSIKELEENIKLEKLEPLERKLYEKKQELEFFEKLYEDKMNIETNQEEKEIKRRMELVQKEIDTVIKQSDAQKNKIYTTNLNVYNEDFSHLYITTILSKPLVLEGLRFKSVGHYLFYKLLADIPQLGKNESYILVNKTDSLAELSKEYTTYYKKSVLLSVKSLLYFGYSQKFRKDSSAVGVLFKNPVEMKYKYYSNFDDLLGYNKSTKSGLNLVGDTIEIFRKELKMDISNVKFLPTEVELNIKKIMGEIYDTDIFKSWLNMRVKDISRTLYNICEWQLPTFIINIDKKMVENVIKLFYKPCFNVITETQNYVQTRKLNDIRSMFDEHVNYTWVDKKVKIDEDAYDYIFKYFSIIVYQMAQIIYHSRLVNDSFEVQEALILIIGMNREKYEEEYQSSKDQEQTGNKLKSLFNICHSLIQIRKELYGTDDSYINTNLFTKALDILVPRGVKVKTKNAEEESEQKQKHFSEIYEKVKGSDIENENELILLIKLEGFNLDNSDKVVNKNIAEWLSSYLLFTEDMADMEPLFVQRNGFFHNKGNKLFSQKDLDTLYEKIVEA